MEEQHSQTCHGPICMGHTSLFNQVFGKSGERLFSKHIAPWSKCSILFERYIFLRPWQCVNQIIRSLKMSGQFGCFYVTPSSIPGCEDYGHPPSSSISGKDWLGFSELFPLIAGVRSRVGFPRREKEGSEECNVFFTQTSLSGTWKMFRVEAESKRQNMGSSGQMGHVAILDKLCSLCPCFPVLS